MDEYRKNNFSNPMETCWKIQLARRRLSYFQGEITKNIADSKQGSPVRRTVSSQMNGLDVRRTGLLAENRYWTNEPTGYKRYS